jgi:transposase-like protein
LTISSDACKGLTTAIASEFSGSEHRKCMRHLMENLKKKRYHCNVFTNHMWPAAKAYTTEKYHYHLSEINEASPEAIAYLEKDHKQLLCRSKFSELSKCDYVNNNISESFNS